MTKTHATIHWIVAMSQPVEKNTFCVSSFKSYNNPVKEELLETPCYAEGHWELEILERMSKVI